MQISGVRRITVKSVSSRNIDKSANEHVSIQQEIFLGACMLLFDTFSLYGLIYLLGVLVLFAVNAVRSGMTFSINIYFCIYLGIAAIIGGRLFYILFYNLEYYLGNPRDIPALHKGGMAFHGALLGIIVCALIIGRNLKFTLLDNCAITAMLTIPLGRIANFLRGELKGRESSIDFGSLLGSYSDFSYPSTLFEAAGEGPLILIVIIILSHTGRLQYQGSVATAFSFLYALVRFMIEFTRLPDPQIGYLFLHLTLGQYLCLIQAVLTFICHLMIKNHR